MVYNIVVGRDKTDKEKFGDAGLVYLGKGYVKMGNFTSLSNKIWMDIARSHVVLVAGKRGCLTEDTMIFTDKGYKKIKNFIEKEDKILSFNKEKRVFELETAKLVEYPISKEDLLEIELKDGRKIKLTKEHPLLLNYGKYLFWRMAQELKEGDKVVLPTNLLETKINDESTMVARILGFVLSDGTISKRKGRWKDGRGYWCDGTKSRLRIFCDDENVLKQAKEDIENEFKTYTKVYKRNDCNCTVVQSLHAKIVDKLNQLGVPLGKKSEIIKFPEVVWKSSNEFKANFLSALFSCDGYISKKGHQIEYYCKSRRFLEEMQMCLSHFKIESVIRERKAKCNGKIHLNYRLLISDNQSVENFKKIGFISKYKQERLISHTFNGTKKRKTFYVSHDLVCRKIAKIRIVNGINKVYDLSVNKNHSFIANGIISHNSGKSYSLGIIAEELSTLPQESAKNISSVIFDTMGIFWTMKYKNDKDKALLSEWELKARSIPLEIFVPFGKIEEYKKKNIPFDKTFALKASELDAEDWLVLFNLEFTTPSGVLVERAIAELKSRPFGYNLEDVQNTIEKDEKSSQETKEIVSALFKAADSWGIFSKSSDGTEISELAKAGLTTVLDISVYSSVGAFNIRALVISIISRKLFKIRMDARKKEEIEAIQHGQDYLAYKPIRQEPLVWIFIDECLTGDTEIITSKNHTSMQEIINKFERGEQIEVLGFDTEKREFSNYPVTGIYKKGKRKIIELKTETGRKIKCTPEHRVLTREGFASAFSVNEIASPLIQHYSEDTECIKARLLGHLFGDGWASEKTQSLGFSGKINPSDLNNIKRDLSVLGFKSSNIFSRNTSSDITNSEKETMKVNGTSHSISASFNAYRYFNSLGIIKGDKIIQPSKIPDWIKKGNKKIKAEFLAALMGSDGQKMSSAKNAKGDFNALRFSFNKLENLKKEALEYAYEIKDLFESLEVKISSIDKRTGNLRKNGNKTIKIVITLAKNIKNIIKFLENIGYRYCTEKEDSGMKWLAYLKARLFLKEEREKIYKKAILLHNEGLGKTKISHKLLFPEPQIRDWIYNRVEPGVPKDFPSYEEWTQNRLDSSLLYERVVKIEEKEDEEVYDLSVEKVHNFVSNGMITHNCHEFLPREGKTPATDALIQILREGRQPGISLVLATQQPGQIHKDVMTQSDIVISHRVTSKTDMESLNEIMQTYLLESIRQQMDNLPALKGSAILLDDNSERIYSIRMRPRFTWHGGEAPSAVKTELIL